MRTLTYQKALDEALLMAMERDSSIFAMGIGVDDHKAVFGSTSSALKRFGKERVFDTPIAEGGMTGIAMGAALNGMKPVHIHIRADFLYLAMDQLFNMAAKWYGMFGGHMNVPLVIRAVIGRSWGQGAQHSQSLSSFFMHVPGVKVVMPTTPYDAKGCLIAALHDPNPVIIIEHRLLYYLSGDVPQDYYHIPFGRTFVRKKGNDITIVANSYMVAESLKAAEFLEKQNIFVEIIDPVSLNPLDHKPILESLKKTGRLIIIDTSWVNCGVSAEIAARVAEENPFLLKKPIVRLGSAHVACPVSKPLEDEFYPTARKIVEAVYKQLDLKCPNIDMLELKTKFKGPF